MLFSKKRNTKDKDEEDIENNPVKLVYDQQRVENLDKDVEIAILHSCGYKIPNTMDEMNFLGAKLIDFMDDLSECKMGNEHILRDNEFYNIHYSTNIYNKSLDINETAIGEFRFEDTKINDMRYYVIKELNFKNGIIVLL